MKYLGVRGYPELVDALYRCRGPRLRLDSDSRLVAILWVASGDDLALLASATRSHTGSEMPGPLDHAFESALPGHQWPDFRFVLAGEAVGSGVSERAG